MKPSKIKKIRFGLFSRMLTALFMLLVSTLTILSVSLLQNTAKQFDDFRLKHAQSLAHTLAKGSLDALITEDYELLERFVKSSLPPHHGAYAYLTRPNGQILSSTDINLIAIKIIPPTISGESISRSLSYNDRPIVEVIYKANIGKKHIANAHIAYYTDQGTFSYLGQAKDIIIDLIILLIVILVGTYIIVSRIKTPVINLINTVANTSHDSPINLPQNLHMRNDEVGALARAFDDVFTRLCSASKKIKEAKDYLELRVEKRTQQLEAKNQELDAAEKRINTIMDNAGDSIITVNKEGLIESFNVAAQKLFGYELNEVKGKNVKLLMPDSFHNPHTTAFEKYVNSVVPYPLNTNAREVVGKRKDNSEFPMELQLNHINLHGDNLFIGIVRDITFEKQAKENLIKSNELLEEKVNERTLELNNINKELVIARDAALDASNIKSEFLSTMSHELRTPLHAISGYESLLSATKLNEKQLQFCKNINIGAQNLLEIINDILDFSAFESGELKLENEALSLKATLDDICSMFIQSAEYKGLKLTYNIDENIPNQIYSDPKRLRQIIVNLISNAIKFTKEGSVKVNITLSNELKTDEKNTSNLIMTVSDTGIGIAKTEFDRIFTPFYQVDGSVTRSYGGTGLGLAMTNRIIELMGGNISLESNTRQGSTFTVSIPLITKDNYCENDKIKDSTIQDGSEKIIDDLDEENYKSDKKILIVEDNEINAELLSILLDNIGYSADIVENGAVFLDIMKEEHYDLVLMDCQMPILNGYDATQQYRSVEKADIHIPIVAVTANTMAGDKEKCIASGMDDYIEKPVASGVLKKTVRHWLSEHL